MIQLDAAARGGDGGGLDANENLRRADREAVAVRELGGHAGEAVDLQRHAQRELAHGQAGGMAGEQADEGRQIAAAQTQIAARDGADEEGDLAERVRSGPASRVPDFQRDIGERIGWRRFGIGPRHTQPAQAGWFHPPAMVRQPVIGPECGEKRKSEILVYV